MGKDWEKCRTTKLGILNHFGLLVDYFGRKGLEKKWNGKNWTVQIMLDHFGGKRSEKCEMTKIEQSELFWTILVGNESFWTTLVGNKFEKV